MKKLFFLAGIVILLSTACSNDKETDDNSIDGKSSLTISLVGKPQERAVGAPTQAEENVIYSYTVYVFEDNRLEKVRTFTTTGLTQTIDGLTTGVKKVVVVANPPASFPALNVGANYSALASASAYINLDDQVDLDNGLVMSGEGTATLASSPAVNTLNIELHRVVAKIILGTITIAPSQGNDSTLFTLEGVAIIKAKSLSSVGVPTIVTSEPFYSGIAGTDVQAPNIRSYLFEDITVADHDNRFFYIFANESTADESRTLLTLVGTYDGETVYFPFYINAIQRNTQHTINITLRRLGVGSPDPETPSDPADLDITITPEDWVVAPVQNVEW